MSIIRLTEDVDAAGSTPHKSPADTRIVFFGNERLATGVRTDAPTLRLLIAAGYNVVAVVSHHSQNQSRKSRDLEIAAVAAEHNIPLLLPDKPSEIIGDLTALQADIGVLVAYGKIVPQSVIDIFPHGIINIHPSLLPLHRGPTPIESVILDGSTETGVSVMQLVRSMDAGPVYGQTRLALAGTETKDELVNTLLTIGGSMIIELLPRIIDGSCAPLAQDETTASYDNLISKSDGMINFTKPAVRLEREIRAYSAWPKSRAILDGSVTGAAPPNNSMESNREYLDKPRTLEVIILSGHTVASTTPGAFPGAMEYLPESGTLMIETSDGRLCVDCLKPAGKSEMTARAFVAGYGKLLSLV